jgi:hypothetical protein
MTNVTKKYVMELGIIQLFIGISGIAVGVLLILASAKGGHQPPPQSMVTHLSHYYIIPGIILVAVIALGHLAGAAATFFRHRRSGAIAITLGIILCAWIVIQIGLLGIRGFLIFLQPLYFSLGIAEMALGLMDSQR